MVYMYHSFLIHSSAECRDFLMDKSHLSIFPLAAYAFQEIIVKANVKITKGFSMLPSRSLTISDLAFKSFINFDNFELIFEYSVR